VRGYGFQDQLPGIGLYQEVQRRDGIPAMLREGRADFYIDDDAEVDFLLASLEQHADLRVTELQLLPLYLAFARTERGLAGADQAPASRRRLLAHLPLRLPQPFFIGHQGPGPMEDAAQDIAQTGGCEPQRHGMVETMIIRATHGREPARNGCAGHRNDLDRQWKRPERRNLLGRVGDANETP